MLLKRIIAPLMVIVIIASCIEFSVYSENAEDAATLTGNEMGLLKYLNLIDPSSAGGVPTRGKLARLAVIMSGSEPTAATGYEVLFYDVTSEREDYGYIKTAVGLGLFSGYTDGHFGPDDAVSFEQACKVLTTVAGYRTPADVQNAYSNGGYVSNAKSAGILNGITAADVLSFNQLYRMIYNTLHAEPMVQVAYGDKVQFERVRGSTVLEEKLDIIYRKGILNGVWGTTLTYPDNSIRENEILIDYIRYSYNSAEPPLGANVTFYYMQSEDSDRGEVVYLYANERNNYLRINASEGVRFADNTLTYQTVSGSSEKVRFSARPDVIYNGIAFATFTDEMINGAEGILTLVDNDNDDNYDVMLVTARQYLLVGAIDVATKTVTDRFDDSFHLSLDEQENNSRIELLRGSRVMLFELIQEGDLLIIEASANETGRRLIRCRIVTPTVAGILGSGDEIGGDSISVSGTAYPIRGRLRQMLDNGDLSLSSAFDNTVQLYVYEGCAVMADLKGDASQWMAYLIDMKYTPGLQPVTSFKLVRSAAKIEILTGAKKISIDGVSYKDANKISDALAESARASNYNEQYPLSQPVLLRLNSDGEIISIDTVRQGTGETEHNLNLEEPAQNLRHAMSNHSSYTIDTNALKVTISSDTKVLWVPADERDNEGWYDVRSGWPMFANANYVTEYFNTDECLIPKYMVIYNNVLRTVAASAAPCPVISTARVLNADGDEITKLRLYADGAAKDFNLAPQVTVPIINVGDCVRYRLNNKGEISVIDVVFRPRDLPAAGSRITEQGAMLRNDSYTSDYRTVFGTVWAKKGAVIMVTTSVAEDDGGIANRANINNYLVDGNTRIYVYDERNSTRVFEGSAGDITTYTAVGADAPHVFLYQRDGVLRQIYIIRGGAN